MYTVSFGDYNFDMFPGAYMELENELEVTIDGQNMSLDYIDSILQNPANLQLITISDPRPMVVARFQNYIEVVSITKNPHYQTQKFDGEGNLDEKYGDAIIIRIRKPSINTTVSKMQATMEYIAIMSDIDIDEEI